MALGTFSRRRIGLVTAVCISFILALSLGLGLGLGLKDDPTTTQKDDSGEQIKKARGPNVLVIMTDDQDMLLGSLASDIMPNVRSLIGDKGVTYNKHYCTVAWCCPSRVSFLTGKAAHNTNVTSTTPPYGGWPKFTTQGLNENYLPVWINESGISTYYIGKLMNGYGVTTMATPTRPRGWTNSSFLLDPHTYNYFKSWWSDGETTGVEKALHKGVHTTYVTRDMTLAMLEQARKAKKQFFMMVAPVAPHQELAGGTRAPPPPRDGRYKDLFLDHKVPRRLNFNPDQPSGASWVRGLAKLNASDIQAGDDTHVKRLQNLAAIDDMVGTTVQTLEDAELLENTYIVYTSDNGFHIGNHRLLPGKRCPYEEDINIPLLIRGPGVPQGKVSYGTHSHTDMAPTILKMLGLEMRPDFDGTPIAYSQEDLAVAEQAKSEMVNVEFWTGGKRAPNGFKDGSYYDNTYKALRLVSAYGSSDGIDGQPTNHSLFYSVWCTGERELYNMNQDYEQMDNRLLPGAAQPGQTYYGRPETALIDRLDALLMVMKGCKTTDCQKPWSVLFPDDKDSVHCLGDAMQEQYDEFFHNQPKIKFSSCQNGHIIAEEGPQRVIPYNHDEL